MEQKPTTTTSGYADSASAYRASTAAAVRAVLTANKDGVLLRDFQREYRSLVFEDIPHRRLGYGSLLDMFRDMPTVVRVKDMGGDRAEILLRAVADEKTEHMAKLVARQRDSDYRTDRETRSAMKRDENPPVATMSWPDPTFISRVIDALRELGNYKKGATDAELERALRRQHGRELPPPTAFGFPTMRALLTRMAEYHAVETKAEGTGFWVRAAKATREKWENEDANKTVPLPHDLTIRAQLASSPSAGSSVSKSRPPSSPPPPSLPPPLSLPPPSISSSATRRRLSSSGKDQTNEEDDNLDSVSVGVADRLGRIELRGDPSSLGVPRAVRDKLAALMTGHPNGVAVDELVKQYRTNLGGDLDEAVANYAGGIREMVRLMPDVLVVGTLGAYDEERKWKEEIYVYPLSAAKRQKRPPAKIPAEVRGQLSLLLNRYPCGIEQDILVRRYTDTWGQALNVVQMGFSDLSDFLNAAGDFVVVENAATAGRARGHNIIRLKPGTEVAGVPAAVPAIPKGVAPKTFVGQSIPTAALPEEMTKMGSKTMVYVTEVIDPECFYFVLEDKIAELNSMQQRIQGFFRAHEGLNCSVAASLGREALVGRHFAATYEGHFKSQWHRVLVKKAGRDSHGVELFDVFYLDFGSQLQKSRDQLRLLPACFGVAPAYAHLARLSGVRRPEGRATYQKESARTFRRLLTNPLLAESRGTQNTTTGKMSLRLVNKSGVNIAQELIDQELAEVDPDFLITDSKLEVFKKMKTHYGDEEYKEVARLRLPPGVQISRNPDAARNSNRRSATGPAPIRPQRPPKILTSPIPAPAAAAALKAAAASFAPPRGFRPNRPPPPSRRPSTSTGTPTNTSASPPSPPQSSSSPSVAMYDSGRKLLAEIELDSRNRVHLVNYGGRPYMMSAEISKMFPIWGRRDHLSRMIQLRNLDVCAVAVTVEDGGAPLYEECLLAGIPGIQWGESDLAPAIYLYKLSDVEKCVLEFLGAARGADLIRGLGFERERFDPGHPMWRRDQEEEEDG